MDLIIKDKYLIKLNKLEEIFNKKYKYSYSMCNQNNGIKKNIYKDTTICELEKYNSALIIYEKNLNDLKIEKKNEIKINQKYFLYKYVKYKNKYLELTNILKN